jgi:hypothetical protein
VVTVPSAETDEDHDTPTVTYEESSVMIHPTLIRKRQTITITALLEGGPKGFVLHSPLTDVLTKEKDLALVEVFR